MPQNIQTSLTDRLAVEVARILAPLTKLRDGQSVASLLRALGWELPSATIFGEGLVSIVTEIERLMVVLRSVTEAIGQGQAVPQREDLTARLKSAIRVITGEEGLRKDLSEGLTDYREFVAESGILSNELPKRLFDYLILSYLKAYRPSYYGWGLVLGLFDAVQLDAQQSWEPGPKYELLRVNWSRLTRMLHDPKSVWEVYGAGSQKGFDPRGVLARLEVLLECLRVPGGLYSVNESVQATLNQAQGEAREIRMPLSWAGDWPSNYGEAGLSILPLSDAVGNRKGVAAVPYLLGSGVLGEELADGWQWLLEGAAAVDGGLGLLFWPPDDLEIQTALLSRDLGEERCRVELNVQHTERDVAPYVIFGSPGGSRLSFDHIGMKLLASVSEIDHELVAEIGFDALTVRIDLSDADSFIRDVLGGRHIENSFDVKIGLSNKDGLYIGGSGGCEVTVPIAKTVGPITFDSAFVAVEVSTDIEIVLAVSLSARLGPISAKIECVGLRLPLRFSDDQFGNLGPVDVSGVSFLPPLGAGLAINGGGIVGSGFLEFDETNKRYAGIVKLNAGELDLVGIGLITTQMPDGSEGFSLLINIGVEFSPPIQLPYNFTLSGVGGLIGLNRTMDIEVLRAGLRARTLDSILFPGDAIANADSIVANAGRIISNLRSVFPPANDRVVVGPMVKLGWGSPRIIQADIGIFIELPEPVRIALLGQITAKLPQEHNAVIELHIDVLGVIDFESETLSIDATLYDSRIYEYALTGDAAVRFSWGDSPSLALSLGGFHPRFSPPARFPALRRLTLNLSQGPDLQLYCSAYHAITSNTVQFGATVALRFKKSGATLEGRLSFDTLIYLSPFAFVADISGNVVARYRGHRLASVALTMVLSGPTPWNARGRASFGVLMWDVTRRFNKTWGPRTPLVIAPKDAWPLLKEGLEQDENWGSRLPAGVNAVEALASQEGDGQTLLVHPMGSLDVRQNVLPLEIELQKIGGAPVEGQSCFSIEHVTVLSGDVETSDGPELTVVDVEDDFARAQFLSLSDDDRLSLPAFEKMKAGISIDVGGIDFGSNIRSRPLEYETIPVWKDRTSGEAQLTKPSTADAETLKHQLQASAAGRSELRRTGRHKYAVAGKEKVVKLRKDRYQVVKPADTDSMEPVVVAGGEGRLGRVQAEQAMSAYIKTKPDSARQVKIAPVSGAVR